MSFSRQDIGSPFAEQNRTTTLIADCGEHESIASTQGGLYPPYVAGQNSLDAHRVKRANNASLPTRWQKSPNDSPFWRASLK